jgi:DNA-binding transcriptional MerR regulator/methanogenic corrinoid protein MtbC1
MATTDPDGGAASTPPPMLTVAAVARRLGVAPSTLRTWDRRYHLGPSAHTAGSHRRYSAHDLERLVVMRRLTLEGVPPADAARIALARGDAPSPFEGTSHTASQGASHSASQGAAGELVDEAAAAECAPEPEAHERAALATDGPQHGAGLQHGAGPDAHAGDPLAEALRALAIPAARTGSSTELAPLTPDSTRRHDVLGSWPFLAGASEARATAIAGRTKAPGRSGGGRVVALPDGSPAARGLARAAMSLDSGEVHRLFADAVHAFGVREAWDTMAMPVLQSIGERWRVTGDGVDVEHAFSEAIVAVLHAVTAGLRRPRNHRPVVLSCAEGDYHTLPLHALAAALAAERIGVRVLGVGMPPSALVAAVRRSGPAGVFLYARLPVADVEVLDLIPRQRPAPRLVVGGPGWSAHQLPPQVAFAHTLGEGVDRLVEAVDL